jgi:2-amino-4-hydroxy-6-hydroxymethyldihydropteridine diphosphokinase
VPLVILGLGSNIQPQVHLSRALVQLRSYFNYLELSPVYETQAVGFSGANFWNLIAGIQTDLPLEVIKNTLREIELQLGRAPDAQKWSDRCIDIDILMFGTYCGVTSVGYLPRVDILRFAYVLAPLADVYPDVCHAETGCTFAEHWRDFTGGKSGLLQRFDSGLLS